MKFYFFSVLYFFCLSGWVVGAEDATPASVKAAGVIAYAVKNKQTHLLLANHQGLAFYRGYGAFGGGIEHGESIAEAALREFHEETRCAYKDQNIQLSEQSRVQVKNYVSYIIELPYIDEATLLQLQEASSCNSAVFRERGPLRWYALRHNIKDRPLDDVATLLESAPWHIWPASKKVIKKALERGLIIVK